jgi:hypothetical protein
VGSVPSGWERGRSACIVGCNFVHGAGRMPGPWPSAGCRLGTALGRIEVCDERIP